MPGAVRIGEIAERVLREPGGKRRIPASTYRLQLGPGFGFGEAAALLPYLRALGVDTLYLSPVLTAAPGSTHGYDVVDHGLLSEALGGEAAYRALADGLAESAMGQLVDFVPNHMGVGPFNAWWMDLLENGPSSVHAFRFDVDWNPLKPELRHRVLVPVLGDQYGAVLERGELRLERDGGAFFLRYHDHAFPIAPRSVPLILRHGIEALAAEIGADHPTLQELESICTALAKLAPREEATPETVLERAREKEVAKRRLAGLCAESQRIALHVDGNVAQFNGSVGDARSFDRLHALLEGQGYRLAYWRVAGDEINYRRFFDINSLAALRMEEPGVFSAAHRRVLGLVREGVVTGLRIDHPDGLYDPTGYFRRLQAAVLAERGRALAEAEGAPLDPAAVESLVDRLDAALANGRVPERPLYVVVEKILAVGEKMPESWPVDGTTGYEFLNAVSGLFVDPAGAKDFRSRYARWRGRSADFADEAYQTKKLVCSSLMASEIQMLAHRLDRASETDRRTRDFTQSELTRALVEYVSLLPVYRTYVTPRGEVDPRDRAYVESTVARARRRAYLLDPSIFDFLRDVLLQRYPGHLAPEERRAWLEFTLKLQQLTGAITAKALEDTAFYAYVRLVSLNEVGGDPERFGTSPEAFHAENAQRLQRWPGSLLATETHDAKRGEDARLRIDALSELPEEWWESVRRWARTNRRFSASVEGHRAPDRDEELLVYQTLVGTLPEDADPGASGWEEYAARIQAYVEKALREAKRHTSWTHPDAAWEGAARDFVAALLSSRAFLEDASRLARRVAAAARLSSLAQTALKLASPGVCDVYQGCELWDLSLVDPDNRRPVDFAHRAALLAELDRRAAAGPAARAALAREIAAPAALPDGRAKLWLLASGLRLRRSRPDLFLRGEYLPLPIEGEHRDNAVAFARRLVGQRLVCVVPRLLLRLLDAGGPAVGWRGRVRLPPPLAGRYEDVVTGEVREGDSLELSACFEGFPVALLLGEEPPDRPAA